MNPVWIIDDDRSIRWVLEKALGRENIAARCFGSADEVLAAFEHGARPQVVISDIRMPGKSGLDLLRHVKEHYPDLPVIIMTAYSDLDSAVAAFQGGAFEYLPKPFDVDQAVDLVRRAITQAAHQNGAAEETRAVPEILGQGAALQEVFRAIGRLSQSHATVLINGESGTGKELVARALHRHSPRRDSPFIAINTAAIPRDLLESELFGHEKGAFTGAAALRRGRFEQADNGTLFLDEIGDIPASLQVKLLRVLQEKVYEPLGSNKPVKADVRIIAATNRNLQQLVQEGLFREDLFYRLNVVKILLPPLRDRMEDVPMLAEHFVKQFSTQQGKDIVGISDEALGILMRYNFPGNIRELENIIEYSFILCHGGFIRPEHLPEPFAPKPQDSQQTGNIPLHKPQPLDEIEKQAIFQALERNHWRRMNTCRELGISKDTLRRKIERYGLKNPFGEDLE